LTKAEAAERFPELFTFARALRAEFGDQVRMVGAIDHATGEAIGSRKGAPPKPASLGGTSPATRR
jgi:hypothetical protein